MRQDRVEVDLREDGIDVDRADDLGEWDPPDDGRDVDAFQQRVGHGGHEPSEEVGGDRAATGLLDVGTRRPPPHERADAHEHVTHDRHLAPDRDGTLCGELDGLGGVEGALLGDDGHTGGRACELAQHGGLTPTARFGGGEAVHRVEDGVDREAGRADAELGDPTREGDEAVGRARREDSHAGARGHDVGHGRILSASARENSASGVDSGGTVRGGVETGRRARSTEEAEMPNYLLSVHVNPADLSDDEMQQSVAEVDALNAEMQTAGVWVFAGGLHPAESARVVRSTASGEILTTDGPFAESKEQMAGFWILEAADDDAATSWARKATVACRGPVEVRPFHDDPDA